MTGAGRCSFMGVDTGPLCPDKGRGFTGTPCDEIERDGVVGPGGPDDVVSAGL